MTDQAAADRKDPAAAESDDREESWLRRAVREPGAEASAALPLIGQVIDGKYRIDAHIGRGGMGAVYRATHVVSEKEVAIKWMLSPATDDQARRRFVREARAVGRIDHPNVVALYDVVQDADHAYLVMELLRGQSLRSCIASAPLAASVMVDLLVPAMHGVAAAHKVGVVHRDLKPDNIFLCEAKLGRPTAAKVLDFGVASMAASEAGDSTLTKDGTVLGSPAYMSPEQIKNPHDVDGQTDVYAFGVIMYEALAGVRPFPAENYAALIFSIANSAPKPLTRYRADLPAGLEQVVLRAFARDPAQRQLGIDELIAEVSPFATSPR